MTTTIDRQIDNLEKLDDLENYKGKWKNLHFDESGRSTLSINSYKSALEAEISFLEEIRYARIKGLSGWFLGVENLHVRVPWNNENSLELPKYSHRFQIPVGDA